MVTRLATLRGITAIFLMKVCHKLVETYFSSVDPAVYHFSPGKKENGTLQCIYNDTNSQSGSITSSFTSWIYTFKNILPVLGGVISSAYLGYISVLQIGGVVMLLATALMSVSVYQGFICEESSAIVTITWLLLPLFFGLTQPNLQYGLFMWYNHHPVLPTVIPALYYLAAEVGICITQLISPLSAESKLGSNSTLIFIGQSVLFIALSFVLPNDFNQQPFEMPRKSLMRRYFIIFSGLSLFIVAVADYRPTMYIREINSYLSTNGTNYLKEYPLLSPNWVNRMTMSICCLLVILLAPIFPTKLQVHRRLKCGIALESCVALGLMIFTAVAKRGSMNTSLVATVYSTSSVMDGVAEALVLIAAYDLVQQKVPNNRKAFVFGIVYTVWEFAQLFSRIYIDVIMRLASPPFYVYHLIILVALVACFVYQVCLAEPIAENLILYHEDYENIVDEPVN